MNVKKLLCVALAMLLALSAAALAEDDLQAQLDAANARIQELEAQVELYQPFYEQQIVVEYGEDGIVWRDDAMEQFEAAASTYSQYGLDINQYADQIKQDILEMLAKDAILDAKSAELGLSEPDEETLAGLQAEAAQNFENYIESYKSYFATEGATDEEAREQTIAQLEAYGLTLDTLTQQMLDSYAGEQLYNFVTADVTVDDEEIRAAYDKMVEENQTDFADDHAYNNARSNGEPIAWNPEGYRAVKHVLIEFDDEQSKLHSDLQSTLSDLNSELEALDAPAEDASEEATEEATEETETAEAEPEETEAPRTREEIQSDIGRVAAEIEALYSQLLPEAEKVIEEFEGGADFDSLIEKYGKDPGMQSEPTATIGYAVSADSSTWDPAFTEGAMSIAEVGQISGPIYGTYGIHIIYYMSDITPGAVPFEDIAAEAETRALDDKTTATYNDQVNAWVEEAAPVYHIDRF